MSSRIDERRKWRRWYVRHREQELARYRERYTKNPKFRKRGIERALKSYEKKKAGRIVEHPIGVAVLSNIIGIPVSQINKLQREGLIPRVSDRNKYRTYSPRQVLTLLLAVQSAMIDKEKGKLDKKVFGKIVAQYWNQEESDGGKNKKS